MSENKGPAERRGPRPRTIEGKFSELEAVMYAVRPRHGSAEDEERFADSEDVRRAATEFATRLDEIWKLMNSQPAGRSDAVVENDVVLAGVGLDVAETRNPSFEPPSLGALASHGSDGGPVKEGGGGPVSHEPADQAPAQRQREGGKGGPNDRGETIAPVAIQESPTNEGAVKEQGKVMNSSAKQSGAIFSLPNAKAGQEYLGVPKCTGKENWTPKFRNAQAPEGLGLAFDEGAGAFTGVPLIAGEHKIHVEWSSNGAEWHTGVCSLLVNPDPRSLWKVLEPPAEAPYRKPHTDGRTIDCGGFKMAVGSRRGRSHEHTGGFRDDDFWIEHDQATGWSVMIVCDGAGSAQYSRWGSRLAAVTGGNRLMSELKGEAGARLSASLDSSSSLETIREVGKEFGRIYQEMGLLCVKAIDDEAASQGAAARDYATTMLAVAVRKRGSDTFLATFWMGDGAIGVYGPRGKIRLMGSPDGGDYVGQTKFLDRSAMLDKSVGTRINVGRYTDVVAVMAMTDGVSDPSFETDSGMSDARKWDSLWDVIAPSLDGQKPHEGLIQWMDFFTSGHHDDRTIAVLW